MSKINQSPNKSIELTLDALVPKLIADGAQVAYGLRKLDDGRLLFLTQCGPIVIPVLLDDKETACKIAQAIHEHFIDKPIAIPVLPDDRGDGTDNELLSEYPG